MWHSKGEVVVRRAFGETTAGIAEGDFGVGGAWFTAPVPLLLLVVQAAAKAGIDIDEGTLYPPVRRLADQGLLSGEWRQGEGRERRYYQLSSE